MQKPTKHKISEAELCAGFIAEAERDGKWKAYPETAGFDILMSHLCDGVQIGIEAKLALNAKVIGQALPKWRFDFGINGPDYRAVLVPSDAAGHLSGLCAAIGITVIRFEVEKIRYHSWRFQPQLPSETDSRRSYFGISDWHDWAPLKRRKLPDYVPDVAAGAPAPLQLTTWKIKAIKLAIILEQRPVTRADFKSLRLDPKRWLDPWPGWLKLTPAGYVRHQMPDFKAMHPRNYAEIAADSAKWMPKVLAEAEQTKLAV